jgi:hypothetical protein
MRPIVLLIFISTLTQSKAFTMSMNYFIQSDKETNCKKNFGNSLSFFFEQIGGYGENAEVIQVEKILNIDLSLFQKVSGESETENGEIKIIENWINIDTLRNVAELFLNKINLDKDFYKKIIHNENIDKERNEIERINKITDPEKRASEMKQLEENPTYFYPPNFHYFENGQFIEELKYLLETLNCFKKNNVEKAQLIYM